MTSRIMGFYDVTGKIPRRHARHIYGFSRKYETIDPFKQPMRFPQFYLQYDKILFWKKLIKETKVNLKFQLILSMN